MSVMISQEKGKAAFTIKKGKLLLVGGGTGLVPLMRLLTFFTPTDDVTIIMGAKTKNEVFFEDYANRLLDKNKHQVIVTTEDGTYGQKGLVTDIMDKLCQSEKFDAVYTCGPEFIISKIFFISN